MRFILVVFSVILFQYGNGQSVYIPRDVKDAYHKETRSINGSPGKNYWQNKASYIINIETTPPSRIIKGNEQIVYANNSPDTLKSIVVRLFQNQHIANAPKDEGLDSSYYTSGITINAYSINGVQKKWIDPQMNITVKEILLDNPLMPQATINITFDWTYEISTNGDREGMIDSSTYFCAYFYPHIAVYDDFAGWNRIPFTGRQEFYNDFCDYTLNVSVPEKYIVWSTGKLQNVDQLLEKIYVDRLNESIKTDSVIHIITKEDIKEGNITKKNARNIWTWKADYIPDVAFGISDHYVWDGTSILVDSLRPRVYVQAAYNDTAWDFHHVANVTRATLDYLSNQSPGIPYPYPKMTVMQGYADEEYPMMVNDASYDTYREMQWTTNHEVIHSYFPFYMGTNETRAAFMDEGWATFYELQMQLAQMPRDTALNIFTNFRLTGYTKNKTPEVAMPITTPSYMLTGKAYSYNSYAKPALAYLALKDLLGDDEFKMGLQFYIKMWNGKHPLPNDFFNCFNTATKQNLDWFWDNWFYSTNYIDVGISNVIYNQNNYTCLLENIGGFDVPVALKINYIDGTNIIIHKSPAIWKTNAKKANIKFTTKNKIMSINLVEEIFLDSDTTNDFWKPQIDK